VGRSASRARSARLGMVGRSVCLVCNCYHYGGSWDRQEAVQERGKIHRSYTESKIVLRPAFFTKHALCAIAITTADPGTAKRRSGRGAKSTVHIRNPKFSCDLLFAQNTSRVQLLSLRRILGAPRDVLERGKIHRIYTESEIFLRPVFCQRSSKRGSSHRSVGQSIRRRSADAPRTPPESSLHIRRLSFRFRPDVFF